VIVPSRSHGRLAVKKQFIVSLTAADRALLTDLIASGVAPARAQTHVRILLKADQGEAGPAWTDVQIATALETGLSTVARVRKRWMASGLKAAIHRQHPRRTYQRKLDGHAEAHLVALACAVTPTGRRLWSLRMLAAKLVEAELVDQISAETVRTVLKKTNLSPG